MIVCRLAYWSVLLLRQTCLARVQINENMGSNYEFATLTFQSPRRPWFLFHASALRTRTDKQIEDFLLFSTGGGKKKSISGLRSGNWNVLLYRNHASIRKQTLSLIVGNKLKHRPLVAGSIKASFKQLTGGPRVKSKGSIRIWITFTQKRLPVIWVISYHMDVGFSLLCLQWLSQCLDRSRGPPLLGCPGHFNLADTTSIRRCSTVFDYIICMTGTVDTSPAYSILFSFFKFEKKWKKFTIFFTHNEKAKKATTK